MFFTTFFAIWLTSFSNNLTPNTAPLQSGCRPVENDSTIYQVLNSRLSTYRTEVSPEKIYLQLDKTLLEPGESLWFSAWLLHAGQLLPSLKSQVLYVELYNPQGILMSRKEILALEGLCAGDFYFPPAISGGQYKIKAFTLWMAQQNAYFERTITLQHTVLPNVNLKLEFERKAFGPGEVVLARFNGQTIQNKPISLQKLYFNVQIAGQPFTQGETMTDESGQAFIRFTLPEKLESTDGLLNVQLLHEGQQEAISRSVPIALRRLDLQFFPESGQAIAGFPCLMAFKCLNAQGKPADVEGMVLDSKGREVASFRSFHDGMGAFDFIPQPGERYAARISKPFAADTLYPIPEAATSGVSLHLLKQDPQSLRFQYRGNCTGKLFLVGTLRDELCCFKLLESNAPVEVSTANWPMGIARFTLMDEYRTALAERLVFVGRDKGLQVTLKTDKPEYLPREAVNLSVQVNDHTGRPVKGHFALSVVDENLLSYADDKQGNILASLLLEQEVKGTIEAPGFYFDASEPKAEQALHYLLLTQGWRRFTWQKILEGDFDYDDYSSERAIIGGRLYLSEGVPGKGKKIALYPNGRSTVTDEQGFFFFENVDLSRYTGLRIGKGKYVALTDYADELELYIKPPEPLQPGIKYHYEISQGVHSVKGNVNDGLEPLIGATIKATQGDKFIRGTVTDYDGNFSFTLPPGAYELTISYTGFSSKTIEKVKILPGKLVRLNATLANSSVLEEVMITAYNVPLIKQDRTSSAQTVTTEKAKKLTTRQVNTIVATKAGAASIDGGDVNIRGARFNGADYYIDGIRVSGGVPPVQDLEQLSVITKNKRLPGGRHFDQARTFYVPAYNDQKPTEQRTDFRSTIYWNPSVQTNNNGKAEVRFYASDAITNFRITLEGLGALGEVGRAEARFFVQKPLSINLKTPEFVMVGDMPEWHIAVTNKTNYPAGGHLRLRVPAHFTPLPNSIPDKGIQVQLAPGETKIYTSGYTIGFPATLDQAFQVQLYTDEILADAFETSIRTESAGFPVSGVVGGKTMHSNFELQLLEPVEGTPRLTLNAYPSAIDNVIKGMERMLRQPTGCFEQVSSSNYPNLLVLDLLRTTQVVRPEVEMLAVKYLEEGYKKLVGYECKTGGFDWYGRDPGNEVLTAYGLLEFTDMKRVFPVDPGLLERTTKWLYDRRNGKGGWLTEADRSHGWKKSDLIDAYIVWAVAEAGAGQLFQAETEHTYAATTQTENSYLWALLANTLSANRDGRTTAVLEQLLAQQQLDGSWKGESSSVFYSYGNTLSIETTALAIMALMRNDLNDDAVERGMLFLLKNQDAFGFGNTQSTVCALRALTMYAEKRSQSQVNGTLVVEIAGKKVAEQAFSTSQLNQVKIQGLAQYLTGNTTPVSVHFATETEVIPFDLEWQYMSRSPQSAPNLPFAFTTTFAQNTAQVGETVRLNARLSNLTSGTLASPMIILGIPAGLSLQPWQLKKLVDEKECDFYELWNGFAVFHFERLLPNESKDIALDLRVDMAGRFEAPASQAFLYYQNEKKAFCKPAVISLTAKRGE